ncbi:MAG: hypothetical protein AAF430_14340 [Myxococcota bacterium]
MNARVFSIGLSLLLGGVAPHASSAESQATDGLNPDPQVARLVVRGSTGGDATTPAPDTVIERFAALPPWEATKRWDAWVAAHTPPPRFVRRGPPAPPRSLPATRIAGRWTP